MNNPINDLIYYSQLNDKANPVYLPISRLYRFMKAMNTRQIQFVQYIYCIVFRFTGE